MKTQYNRYSIKPERRHVS